MLRFRPLALVALAATALAVPVAVAEPRTMTIPRDGRWAGFERDRGGPLELGSFKLRDRHVRALGFSIPLRCTNTDTGDETTAVFRGGKDGAAPVGRVIPRSGTLRLRWTETDAGREANVLAEITFAAGRPTLTISFEVNDELERCRAFSVIRLRHGPR
jgi:hypothetical protein